MSYGLHVYRADGTLQFSADDDSAAFIDLLEVEAGTGTVSQAYPAIAGRTVEALAVSGNVADTATISYPGGVPTVEVERSADYAKAFSILVL